MTESLKKNEIIPDVVDDFAPKLTLKVTYPSATVSEQELTPAATAAAPTVEYEAEPDALYTVAFVDPDAPSRAQPQFKNWRHWVVVNIKGSDLSTGETLTPYIGPGPPPGTSLHRYTFWVYKQTGPVSAPALDNERAGRRSFSLKDFAKDHHLGHPLGFAFFFAQNQG